MRSENFNVEDFRRKIAHLMQNHQALALLETEEKELLSEIMHQINHSHSKITRANKEMGFVSYLQYQFFGSGPNADLNAAIKPFEFIKIKLDDLLKKIDRAMVVSQRMTDDLNYAYNNTTNLIEAMEDLKKHNISMEGKMDQLQSDNRQLREEVRQLKADNQEFKEKIDMLLSIAIQGQSSSRSSSRASQSPRSSL
jgi:FtsZ-binding cell division protein ZapB